MGTGGSLWCRERCWGGGRAAVEGSSAESCDGCLEKRSGAAVVQARTCFFHTDRMLLGA